MKEEPFPNLPEMDEDPFIEPEAQEEIPFGVEDDSPFTPEEMPFVTKDSNIHIIVPADKLECVKAFLESNQIEWRYM